jgi:hypothetical protein
MTRSVCSSSDDFLWLMSSNLFLTLSQLLARHHRQMVSLVIGNLCC